MSTRSSIALGCGIHLYRDCLYDNFYVDGAQTELLEIVSLREQLNKWANDADEELRKQIEECEAELKRRRDEAGERARMAAERAKPCAECDGAHPVGRHNWEVAKREHETISAERDALAAKLAALEKEIAEAPVVYSDRHTERPLHTWRRARNFRKATHRARLVRIERIDGEKK